MPSTSVSREDGARGRHRRSATATARAAPRALTDLVDATLRSRGYSVVRNKPYAGGFITEHYGEPALGRHALQIEINRALYMDERSLARRPGIRQPLPRSRRRVLARDAGRRGAISRPRRIAAE